MQADRTLGLTGTGEGCGHPVRPGRAGPEHRQRASECGGRCTGRAFPSSSASAPGPRRHASMKLIRQLHRSRAIFDYARTYPIRNSSACSFTAPPAKSRSKRGKPMHRRVAEGRRATECWGESWSALPARDLCRASIFHRTAEINAEAGSFSLFSTSMTRPRVFVDFIKEKSDPRPVSRRCTPT